MPPPVANLRAVGLTPVASHKTWDCYELRLEMSGECVRLIAGANPAARGLLEHLSTCPIVYVGAPRPGPGDNTLALRPEGWVDFAAVAEPVATSEVETRVADSSLSRIAELEASLEVAMGRARGEAARAKRAEAEASALKERLDEVALRLGVGEAEVVLAIANLQTLKHLPVLRQAASRDGEAGAPEGVVVEVSAAEAAQPLSREDFSDLRDAAARGKMSRKQQQRLLGECARLRGLGYSLTQTLELAQDIIGHMRCTDAGVVQAVRDLYAALGLAAEMVGLSRRR